MLKKYYTANSIWWRHQMELFFCVTGLLCGEFTDYRWRGALMFSLICARINGWENNGDAGDLRRHLAYYDIIVMRSRHFANMMWCDAKQKNICEGCFASSTKLCDSMPVINSMICLICFTVPSRTLYSVNVSILQPEVVAIYFYALMEIHVCTAFNLAV